MTVFIFVAKNINIALLRFFFHYKQKHHISTVIYNINRATVNFLIFIYLDWQQVRLYHPEQHDVADAVTNYYY